MHFCYRKPASDLILKCMAELAEGSSRECYVFRSDPYDWLALGLDVEKYKRVYLHMPDYIFPKVGDKKRLISSHALRTIRGEDFSPHSSASPRSRDDIL